MARTTSQGARVAPFSYADAACHRFAAPVARLTIRQCVHVPHLTPPPHADVIEHQLN